MTVLRKEQAANGRLSYGKMGGKGDKRLEQFGLDDEKIFVLL